MASQTGLGTRMEASIYNKTTRDKMINYRSGAAGKIISHCHIANELIFSCDDNISSFIKLMGFLFCDTLSC